MFATFDPFTRFLQRVSAQYGDWIDMRERLDIERHYSPLDTFVLFTDRERAMPALHLDGTLSCREIASARPIHDGYMSALELLNAKDGAPASEVAAKVTAFFDRERALDAEGLLRERYGRHFKTSHEVFAYMDYPQFDQGNAFVGFGLMVDRTRTARWLWSRIVFAHK